MADHTYSTGTKQQMFLASDFFGQTLRTFPPLLTAPQNLHPAFPLACPSVPFQSISSISSNHIADAVFTAKVVSFPRSGTIAFFSPFAFFLANLYSFEALVKFLFAKVYHYRWKTVSGPPSLPPFWTAPFPENIKMSEAHSVRPIFGRDDGPRHNSIHSPSATNPLSLRPHDLCSTVFCASRRAPPSAEGFSDVISSSLLSVVASRPLSSPTYQVPKNGLPTSSKILTPWLSISRIQELSLRLTADLLLGDKKQLPPFPPLLRRGNPLPPQIGRSHHPLSPALVFAFFPFRREAPRTSK